MRTRTNAEFCLHQICLLLQLTSFRLHKPNFSHNYEGIMEDCENTIHNYAFSCILGVKEDFLTPKRMPKNFYQYSALTTFKGVIEHNNLWATHWAYLNDAKELKKGIQIAKFVHSDEIIKGYFKSHNSFGDFEKLISKLSKKEITNKTDAYVLCFSEEKDKLNLWQGYGNGYNSIVTAYDSAQIEANTETTGFSIMGRVIYDEDTQKVMMLMFLGRFYLLTKKMYKKFPKQKEKVKKLMSGYLAMGILILSLFTKEKSWKDEKEWRIIYLFPSHNFLDFRETDKGFIPFLHIPIFKEHALKCINGVRLPKSPDYALREKAIRMLWEKACNVNKIKRDLKVEQSSISIVY